MKELLIINHSNPETVQQSFRNIANQLMNSYKLQVGDKYYRIIECEFYYNSPVHPDPYVHGHKRQKETLGEWYFHGSGLDITLSSEQGYGGILIRGLAEVSKEQQRPTKETSVIGPLNVCTAIFASIGSVAADKKIEFGFHYIGRDPQGASMRAERIFEVPRIGLNPANDTTNTFFNRPYRYITFLHLPHKEIEKMKGYLTSGENKQLSEEQYKSIRNGIH